MSVPNEKITQKTKFQSNSSSSDSKKRKFVPEYWSQYNYPPLPLYPPYNMYTPQKHIDQTKSEEKSKKKSIKINYDDDELCVFLLSTYYGDSTAQCYKRFSDKFPYSTRQKSAIISKYSVMKAKFIEQLL